MMLMFKQMNREQTALPKITAHKDREKGDAEDHTPNSSLYSSAKTEQ